MPRKILLRCSGIFFRFPLYQSGKNLFWRRTPLDGTNLPNKHLLNRLALPVRHFSSSTSTNITTLNKIPCLVNAFFAQKDIDELNKFAYG